MDENDVDETGEMAVEAEVPDPVVPVVEESVVALDTFARTHFKPADQAAGFLHFARKGGHTRMSLAKWKALVEEFLNKPVG